MVNPYLGAGSFQFFITAIIWGLEAPIMNQRIADQFPASFSKVDNRAAVEAEFRKRTPKSAELMQRSAHSMPGGLTRGFGFHWPYPAVMERGEGCYLWDVDGNRYIDLVSNGLALIHGHAFAPVVNALAARLPQSWAWLGTSLPQIEFAETLCARLANFERVIFTNSGTESGMLAVKLARRFTGLPLILKLRGGYHGSYSDLEAGLQGRGEIVGHTLLAEFNDLPSFERKLEQYQGQVAAVLVEPVMYSGVVMVPEPDFLGRLQTLAQRHGALFILDDCLMLRLAYGGSAEKWSLAPDITFLGKFLGGGTPLGATGGRAEIMDLTDPRRPDALYHGGSYNGNGLGCVAGRVTLDHLTRQQIAQMDELMLKLRAALEQKAARLGLPLTLQQTGSVMGVYFTEEALRAGTDAPNEEMVQAFHLACINNGLHIGPGGLVALTTAIKEPEMAEVIDGMTDAMEQVAS
jgi:glutamate-1-semialdehyde 2,1-aminomutase